MSRNVVATVIHNEWKYKCARQSMDTIQSKDHRIGTYEINKISLPCFYDKIYIQNYGNDGLALGYLS